MLSPGARRAAVLGSPIGHSLSPALHRAAYAALGLQWRYDAIDVDAQGLPAFLAGLDDTWAGLSLTMPLKEAVLPLLSRTSATAALTASANTVVLGPSGAAGHNTDVIGIVSALRGCGHVGPFASTCIIGAGATARSAVAAAAELGAGELLIVARRPEAAEQVLATAAAVGVPATVRGWQHAGEALRCDLVIATVPGDAGASLAGQVPAPVGTLLDVTYWPWPTTLARAWVRGGGRAVPGSQMLLWQAARQVELMTGLPAPVPAMASALEAAMAGRDNG